MNEPGRHRVPRLAVKVESEADLDSVRNDTISPAVPKAGLATHYHFKIQEMKNEAGGLCEAVSGPTRNKSKQSSKALRT